MWNAGREAVRLGLVLDVSRQENSPRLMTIGRRPGSAVNGTVIDPSLSGGVLVPAEPHRRVIHGAVLLVDHADRLARRAGARRGRAFAPCG